MELKFKKFTAIFTPLLILGCAVSSFEKQEKHPVSWSPEYRMSDYLATSTTIKQQADFQKLLALDWYSDFNVLYTDNKKPVSVNNCLEYFSKTTSFIDTSSSNDYQPFLFLARMCRATEALANAKNSHASYIPNYFLDKSIPKKLPKDVSFQISSSEQERNANDTSKRYWSDINPNLQFERISKEKVKFSDDSGYQTISLLGRGDFNSDNIEDVLIGIQEVVDGGTYSNFRALILSVDKQGEWQFIKEFEH